MDNAAAALALAATAGGLKKIDRVVLSSNGVGLFAVQGGLNDPAHNRVHLYKADAIAQTVEQSSRQVEQLQIPPRQILEQAPNQNHSIGQRL